MTVLILRCGDQYALQKRQDTVLLAGLWQFPNVPGRGDIQTVLYYVEGIGLKPKEILRQVEKKHIFTHVQWDMCGVYLEVATPGGDFCWLTAEQIELQTALPTAFRQFWDEVAYL